MAEEMITVELTREELDYMLMLLKSTIDHLKKSYKKKDPNYLLVHEHIEKIKSFNHKLEVKK
jgi:hypothetical protein